MRHHATSQPSSSCCPPSSRAKTDLWIFTLHIHVLHLLPCLRCILSTVSPPSSLAAPHPLSSSQTSLSSALLSPLLQVHTRRGDTVKHYPHTLPCSFPLWVRPRCAGSSYALLAAKPQMLPHPSAYMFLLPVFGVAFKDLRCSSSFPQEFLLIPFDLLNLWWKLKTALIFHFLFASSFHIFPCLPVQHFSLCAPCSHGKHQSIFYCPVLNRHCLLCLLLIHEEVGHKPACGASCNSSLNHLLLK